MNLKYFALFTLSALLLSIIAGEEVQEKDTPLKITLENNEIKLRSGEKLVMKMKVENTSSETIHAEYIRSRVEYNTLGGIVVNKTSLEWDRDINPHEVCEGVHKSELPVYTLPGTYTIYIWVEYERGKTGEVQFKLHYTNFYIYIILACIINTAILYGKKVYRDRKH